jgi:hypothetical protein
MTKLDAIMRANHLLELRSSRFRQLMLTDGMRRPVSRRDAVGSQVIDVLEAQINKETGNEEG